MGNEELQSADTVSAIAANRVEVIVRQSAADGILHDLSEIDGELGPVFIVRNTKLGKDPLLDEIRVLHTSDVHCLINCGIT